MSVNKVNSDGSLSRIAGGTLYADAPIGTISPFGGSAIPNGYLLCSGQEVSRTSYAELFAAIGTTFGDGNSSTTFNVPDLREAVPKGTGLSGKSSNHYDSDGVALGEFIDDRVQDHLHRTRLHNVYYQQGGSNAGAVTDDGESGVGSVGEIVVGRHGNTTEVKAVGVNYIIKAKQVAVPFDVAEYIRNQNDLGNYENITLPVSSVPYDGLLTVSVSNGGYVSFSVNARNFTIGSASGTSDTSEITVKKGDNVGFLQAGGTYGIYARYYKKRDYAGR